MKIERAISIIINIAIGFAKSHSLEMRLSTGPANTVIWDTQLQFGYIWYPFEQFLDSPELLLGWFFRVKSLAFDVRAGWNIASVTWSNMPYTEAAAGWTPFPFNLTLTTGIAWVFN